MLAWWNTTPTSARRIIVGAIILLLIVTAAFLAGRCSTPRPPPSVTVEGVDAGPGDRAAQEALDADVQREQARLDEMDREHAEEVAAFSAEDRSDYERARSGGTRALAIWFKERTRRILLDGGAS